jgi:hypothetical protein
MQAGEGMAAQVKRAIKVRRVFMECLNRFIGLDADRLN